MTLVVKPKKRTSGRYDRLEDLFNLALRMAQDREGVTLQHVMDQYGVSRRTAERMRNLVMRVFTHTHRVEDGERIGRWALDSKELGTLTDVAADELAELEAAARRAESDGSPPERAASLRRLYGKVRAAMHQKGAARVDADLELLMEAEGSAMRPGPRCVLEAGLLTKVRKSILGSSVVTLGYQRQGGQEPVMREAHPLGVLHGQRPYLVASLPGTRGDPTLFRLDRITSYEIQSGCFARDPHFKLADFAGRSFGVFQEAPINVCLRFDAGSAAEARAFQFHPTQQFEDCLDGSILVRFKAGGRLEMIQHIIGWGESVLVVEPEGLWAALLELLDKLAEHHRPTRVRTTTRAPKVRLPTVG